MSGCTTNPPGDTPDLVTSADGAVLRIVALTRLDRLIPCFASLEEALAQTPAAASPQASNQLSHVRCAKLSVAPLGELGVQRCHRSLGGRRRQMPVHLVSDVDVPMSEEVSKFGDLDATREHGGCEGVP